MVVVNAYKQILMFPVAQVSNPQYLSLMYWTFPDPFLTLIDLGSHRYAYTTNARVETFLM